MNVWACMCRQPIETSSKLFFHAHLKRQQQPIRFMQLVCIYLTTLLGQWCDFFFKMFRETLDRFFFWLNARTYLKKRFVHKIFWAPIVYFVMIAISFWLGLSLFKISTDRSRDSIEIYTIHSIYTTYRFG